MNSFDINNPYLKNHPDAVGVENNRLIVNTRPINYGTFAVTTAPWTDNNFPSDKVYQMIPYQKATSFRINNHTGKTIGIRRRHKKILVDDFEDQNNADWTGVVSNDVDDIDGFYSASIKSLSYRTLTTDTMLDGSEVEVKIKTPDRTSYTSDIAVWDDPNRIGAGSPAAKFQATERNTERNTTYKIIFRMRPSVSEYDVFLEKV